MVMALLAPTIYSLCSRCGGHALIAMTAQPIWTATAQSECLIYSFFLPIGDSLSFSKRITYCPSRRFNQLR